MRHRYLKLLLLFFTSQAYAVKLDTTTSGSITGNYTQVHAVFTIRDIAANLIKPSAQAADLLKNLSIVLPNSDTDPIQMDPAGTTGDNINLYYYWKAVRDPILSDDVAANSTKKISYDINIYVNTAMPQAATLSDIKESDGSIKIRPLFNFIDSQGIYTTGGNSKTLTDFNIINIYSSPSLAPTDMTADGSNKAADFTWKTGSIDYTPTPPNINQQPDEVLIMIFKTDSNQSVALNGYVASSSEATDSDKRACFFDPTDLSDCIKCVPATENIYVSEIPPADSRIQTFSIQSNANLAASVGGLVPHNNYIAVMQYVKGVKQTECKLVTPYSNSSLTELNGGPPAEKGDPRCFIVSAAYGSPFNRHVDIFRWARDQFLMPFAWGQEVVEFYYTHSQPFADSIKNSSSLALGVRCVLWPLAGILYLSKLFLDSPWLVLILALVMFASVCLFRQRHKSRMSP